MYRIVIGSGARCNKQITSLSSTLAYLTRSEMTTLVETGTAYIYRIVGENELLIAEFNLDGLHALQRSKDASS